VNYGGNLDVIKVENLPTAALSWLAQPQSNVDLQNLGGSINYNTQVANKPATVTWNTIGSALMGFR
jgi:hypothetical protein